LSRPPDSSARRRIGPFGTGRSSAPQGSWMETSSVIVVASPSEAELLLAGDIAARGWQRDAASSRPRPVPAPCGVSGRSGSPTRPAESGAVDCGRTQILLPTELTVRRAHHRGHRKRVGGQGQRRRAPAPSPRIWIARHRPCAAGSAAPAAHMPTGCTHQGVQKVVTVDLTADPDFGLVTALVGWYGSMAGRHDRDRDGRLPRNCRPDPRSAISRRSPTGPTVRPGPWFRLRSGDADEPPQGAHWHPHQ